MRGQAGDGALYTDVDGEEHEAVIQSESMSGNANLVYRVDEGVEGLRFAMNVPHKSNTPNDRNYYRHKPSADWTEDILTP